MLQSPQTLRMELKCRQDVVRDRLKHILATRKWSQAYLSKKAGLASGTVYNFLLGNKRIGMMSLRSVAEALDVSEEYLLDLTPNPLRETASSGAEETHADPVKREKHMAQQAIENLFVLLPLSERIETIHSLFRISQRGPDPIRLAFLVHGSHAVFGAFLHFGMRCVLPFHVL